MHLKIPLLPLGISIYRLNRQTPLSAVPVSRIINRKYNKVFCIGSGKTGTTSLEKLLLHFGFTMGNQPTAEVLSRDWLHERNAERIIRFCYTAEAFQDAPFGHKDLYKILDREFPNSKFILTVRNNADEWFDSLVRFHTKLFSSDKTRPPSEEDLKNAVYRYRGYIHEGYWATYGQYGISPYDATAYKVNYNTTNEEKRIYFKEREEDFIEINLEKQEDFTRLCQFLNVETSLTSFPHENRTR